MKALCAVKNKALIRSNGFVGGNFLRRLPGQQLFAVKDPATGEVIAELPRMDASDAESAVLVASKAWDAGWRNSPGNERAKVLSRMAELMRQNANDLALILAAEAGKPISEARGEIAYACSFYEYYAEEAKRIQGEILPANSQAEVSRRRLLAVPQSVGPAALITPWNFPSAMITRKVGPALAAGCSVVIKPAEQTPLSALALCAIAEEAGVPAGVVNCLTVDRSEVEEVGRFLCNSPLIRKVSFTGSTTVGKWLMRESASTVKKVSMELGGNAPFLVFDDADLDTALSALMQAKFRNAGQACIAANRVFVQAGVYDRFCEMVASQTQRTLQCSPQLSDSPHGTTAVGPLIDINALKKLERHVADSVDKGAEIMIGGAAVEELNDTGGTFFLPTVLKGVTKEMLPYKEETFGPLLPIIRFETESEGVRLANDTAFGLAAYACTTDLGRAWRLSSSLDAGMVGINEGAISMSHTPFGGVKESGVGREGGPYGLQEYLETKFICMGGLSL